MNTETNKIIIAKLAAKLDIFEDWKIQEIIDEAGKNTEDQEERDLIIKAGQLVLSQRRAA